MYPTIEDAYQERNRISTQQIDIENFSNKYMSHLNWDGISFFGLLFRNNNVIPLEQLAMFYQTADECRAHHVPAVATIEDEDNEYFEEQKRKEFYDYAVHHCPGFEDKIDWGYFQSSESMPWNLAEQVKKMSSNQQ